MAAVFAGEERVREVLEGAREAEVVVAAVNGPENVVVSGSEEALGAVLGALEKAGVRGQRLNVSHAFHSPLMDPVLQALETEAKKVTWGEPRLGIVSNVTGQLAGPETMGRAAYWPQHLRSPVRFLDGMHTLQREGVDAYLEVGPGPTLLGMGRRCVTGGEAGWFPSLRPGRDDWQQMLESLGALWVKGVEVDWHGFDQPYRRRRVPLPTYPFQRRRYWAEPAVDRPRGRRTEGRDVHPLLGRRLMSPLSEVQYENELAAEHFPFIRDHRVAGKTFLPAAALLEMAAAAFDGARGAAPDTGTPPVEQLILHEPVVFSPDEPLIVQTVVSRGPDGGSAPSGAQRAEDGGREPSGGPR